MSVRCLNQTVTIPLTASPCTWLSQTPSTISQSDFFCTFCQSSSLLTCSNIPFQEHRRSPKFTYLPSLNMPRPRTPVEQGVTHLYVTLHSVFHLYEQCRPLQYRIFRGSIPSLSLQPAKSLTLASCHLSPPDMQCLVLCWWLAFA